MADRPLASRLPRRGPSAGNHTKQCCGLIRDGEAYLHSSPSGSLRGKTFDANTGWKLGVGKHVGVTPEPNQAELHAIREYDKEGFWTG